MDQHAIPVGTKVRLYGYPGIFTYDGPYTKASKYPQGMFSRGKISFPLPYCSVVEYEGKPLAMIGTPMAPPALDYPHEPQFVFSEEDGVSYEVWKARITECVNYWRKNRQLPQIDINVVKMATFGFKGYTVSAFGYPNGPADDVPWGSSYGDPVDCEDEAEGLAAAEKLADQLFADGKAKKIVIHDSKGNEHKTYKLPDTE